MQLNTVYARLSGLPQWRILAKDHRRYQTVKVVRDRETWGLQGTSVDAMAILDNDTCDVLRAIHDIPRVIFTGVIETSSLLKLPSRRTRHDLSLSINIYTAKSDAKDIGNKLSQASAHLQHPFYLETGLRYFNPQYLQLDGNMRCMTHLVGLDEADYRAKQLSDEIGDILESLDSAFVGGVEAAQSKLGAITVPLKRYVNPT